MIESYQNEVILHADLKCGFRKKSFIINDFLQNPHFSDLPQWFQIPSVSPKKMMVANLIF